MKRVGDTYEQIVSFENLLLAARRAQLGKRFRPDVLRFNHNLENELLALQAELKHKIYRPGPYKTFVIFEPKRRLISAAPYRDRVVHHALCNVIEPIFERSFTPSCYANRRNQGSHKALRHCIALSRRYRWCFRADVEKYFPSMDHAILKAAIRRKLKCMDTLGLIDLIIDHSNPQEPVVNHFAGDDLWSPLDHPRGLPIGNLTSQLWANVYLNGLDHRIAQTVGARRYIRYVDDTAVFSDARDALEEVRELTESGLAQLRLRLHPAKSGIAETRAGITFLGFHILPNQVRIRQENLRRFRRRVRQMQQLYRQDTLSATDLGRSIQSWAAHASHGDTWRLRNRLFDSLVFTRD